MRIMVSCPGCLADGSTNNAAVLTLANESIYKVVCDIGHEQVVLLPLQKHEVLFEFGVYAIADGYYREAISTFAVALERYYEYFLRVIGVGRRSDAAFDAAWKEVSSQSERQLGAYIFSHMFIIGNSPELMTRKSVELRNRAIHKGYIPTRTEALSYGDSVASLIESGIETLRTRFRGEMDDISRRMMFPEDIVRAGRIHVPSTYLSCLAGQREVDFRDYVESVKTHNRLMI